MKTTAAAILLAYILQQLQATDALAHAQHKHNTLNKSTTNRRRQPQHTPPSRAATHHIKAQQEPPPAVVDAEKNATPMRKYRLAGIGALATLSAGSAALCLATLADADGARELADNILPFGNEYLSLVGTSAILAGCAWAWGEEEKTRQANIQRIFEEVQRRKANGDLTRPVPADKGAKKKKKKSRLQNKTPAQARALQRASAAQSEAAPAKGKSAQADEGLRAAAPSPSAAGGLVGDFFAEANALARAQALSLNDALEERGVLPKLDQDAGQPEQEASDVDEERERSRK